MATCKKCNAECDTKISKSPANPGREFYVCPSGCKGWIGWADSADETVATVTAPPKATPMVSSEKVKCNSCQADCTQRTSNTAKNRGKMFWGCPKGCKAWNGWVNDATPSGAACSAAGTAAPAGNGSNVPTRVAAAPKPQSNEPPKFVMMDDDEPVFNAPSKPPKSSAPKPQTTKRKAPSINDSDEDLNNGSQKKNLISYYCAKCDKVLDLEHEIQNNLSRLKNASTAIIQAHRLKLKSELQESFSSGDYICERCLGNE